MSSGLRSPASKYRLLAPTPGPPATPRRATPVGRPPILRAEYESQRNVFSTPFSIGTLRRVGSPSPSNGREPSPRGRRPSSTIVSSGDATCSPARSLRNVALRNTE